VLIANILLFLRQNNHAESKEFQPMSRNEQELKGVTLLGNQNTQYSYDYTPEVLETFENKHPENEYLVTLDCPEFTSLCPKTGQPDFGHLIINYIPRTLMVESKSLKLYLFSFRNHGDFHEDCVNKIMKDLVKLMDPKYIEVLGLFTPRGGISIYPYANYGRPGTKYAEMAERRLLSRQLDLR
jgi:7-cyano-7-deazaguanine reductase